MIKIYGIKNCDTMKKALRHLDEQGVDFELHDYKKMGLEKSKLQDWCKRADWELLLNRRGTTWRKLTDEVKESVNKTSAIDLMLENTSMIKRPVLENGDELLIGYDEDQYKQL